MNNTDPAIALPEDQCVLAQNVEFIESMLGERRLGTDAINLPTFLSERDRVPFGTRHLPTADETAAELWALGVSGTTTAKLGRKTTAWSEITISDTPVLTGFSQYRWQSVTLHGKLFFAYKSDFNGLHVWDGTTMRRVGLTEPAAPTAAEAGSGTLVGTRYGRVRYAVVSGSTVLLRSEPSDVLTFEPSGSGASITWTKPAAIPETATHWEIELSTESATGNFYRMSRIAIGTPTYSDTEVYGDGYTSGTLSEDVEDYARPWSARYLTTGQNRLLWAGSHDEDALAARVGWSPVGNAEGVGNDERVEGDTDPTLDLDTYEDGPVTGFSAPVMGAHWLFKPGAIYKLIHTGDRAKAYDADKYTDAIGAIHNSVIAGVDETGQPCLYAVDNDQGPYRLGIGGIKRCGEDLRKTWQTMNIDATKVVTSALYYPKKKQSIWCFATGASNTPDTAIVLHTDKARSFADGVRKGWSVWTGDRTKALSMWLFANNIDDNAARELDLVPFIGLEGLGLIHRCDTGNDDNGVAYHAVETTKPIVMDSILHQFEVRAAAILAKAVTGASIDVTCIRDLGLEETKTVSGVTFDAVASETDVIKALDNFQGAEMHVGQFRFEDVASPVAQWQLNRLDVLGEQGHKA